MLVLSRMLGQDIVIDGGRIVVCVVEISPGHVRLGITAPRDIAVHRREVHEAIEERERKHREASQCP